MNKDKPNILFHPKHIFFWVLAVCLLLQFLFPTKLNFPKQPWNLVLGAVLFGFGFVLMRHAKNEMKASNTNVDPRHPAIKLVTTGPFKFTRNPLYITGFLILIALALFFVSMWFILAVMILFPLVHFGVVKAEEEYLEAKFKEEYLEYKRKVRRWL